MQTERLTTAQAIIKFLKMQYAERDGVSGKFFAGCFGIFGHGNVAGIGQALQQNPDFTYYQTRNEQAMVHTAAAYAKVKNRMSTFACTTSIGPGATNMITAAAAATINRLPVLLLPGDIYARRIPSPVLQQLESTSSQDVSVNNCFRPVSKYWDRINRPEQIIQALPQAMRVLTSSSDTGAVTISLPQDVQAEAFDFPSELFQERIWSIPRTRPDSGLMRSAAALIRKSARPLIICGGGVHYSEASEALRYFSELTGIPVAETFAGKGALRFDNPHLLGAVGSTGTPCACQIAGSADLVIGIGTRYSDFTTSSQTLFQNPDVKFVNINVAEFDAHKHSTFPLVGDAKATLEELSEILKGFHTDKQYTEEISILRDKWEDESARICADSKDDMLRQSAVIRDVNEFLTENDIMVCAAGSLPGDLHKLWKSKGQKNFHLEYGYSCMGYEIAGGLGAKIASPESEVVVMLGDGSYLMMANEIITSIQENYKLIIILIDNHGFSSIGGLSESLGSKRFGTKYRYRENDTNQLTGNCLPVDLAMNARSLGAAVIEIKKQSDFKAALAAAKEYKITTVIKIETDIAKTVPSYSWWEVPVAEVSEMKSVENAYSEYQIQKKNQKYYL
jgi:3D-(3,5/4)-trihydroxycyclohexane-1,2-dione acylhydrolase (decyclizing)